MEALNIILSSLTRTLDGAASSTDWILLMFMFAAVLLTTYGGLILLNPDQTIRRRVVANTTAATGAPGLSLKHQEQESLLNQVLEKLEKHIVQTNEKERSSLRTKMIQAGYMNPSAVRNYYLIRLFLAITLPISFLIATPYFATDMTTFKMSMIALGCCIVGLYLPYRFVTSKLESRQLAITEGFPDALDMMVVCVEAGLGFDATLVRVSSQLTKSHPILALLIGFVNLEVRAGRTRSEALKNLAMRSGVDDVSGFVTLLIQSEALGADLMQTLKVHAVEMRLKRMMRAEEKAHKLPVKLTIPLVLFILPAIFAVVLGPAIINIIRNILPHLGG